MIEQGQLLTCNCLCRLSEPAQKALEAVGSSYSKQISFRDVWGFVGRSMLRGYSPFEEVLLCTLMWLMSLALQLHFV